MCKGKFLLIAAAILFFLGVNHYTLQAQVRPQNISSLNVDELTDQQIQQLLQQAQSNGLTEAQLIQQAQSQGMPAAQAEKLRNRIKSLNQNNPQLQPTNGKTTDTEFDGTRRLNYTPDKNDTLRRRYNADLFESLKPKIFGADLFTGGNSSFEPNLKIATPVNYILGPDDQVNINVYGNSLVNWNLNVSPEGNINIPGVGVINVGGKTIETATSIIKSRLAANNYAIGRGTSVNVSLGNIRSIKVILSGQLVKPGTYTLPSLATVFTALYAAGGPNENGSLRRIEVIRNNRIVRILDVYDFLVKGSQKDNIALQDQDIVRVPTYRTRVELAGQVKIPALFEVVSGETLQNVLDFAGGFTDSAYTARIKVSQISDNQRRLTDVIEADFKNYTPLRGDRYFVEAVINRFANRVTITGAVFKPGEYELQNGLTLVQLIQNAAGLKEDAFTERGTITRLRPDNTTEIISFSVRDVVNRVTSVPLQREDVVSISSIFDLRDKYQITINGAVRKPGTFEFSENIKVEDLVLKAGGLAEGASPNRIEVARRIDNADPLSRNSKVSQVFSVNIDSQLKLASVNFVLRPFDIVSVYSLPGYEKQRTVKIEGEVLYPGNYTIQSKSEKISDLVKRAGGLTASADVAGGSLKRENYAILGIDKTKSDTSTLLNERTYQLKRLSQSYTDSSKVKTDSTKLQPRNNFVGIDLPRILKSPGSKFDLLLEDGDVLRIPKQQQIVRVNGQVLYPSAVVYAKGKSFNEYVLNAGGYGAKALKKRAFVVYANGQVKGTRRVLFMNFRPAVKPGSEVFVPEKPEDKNNNTAQQILGFTTGLASLAAIIFGIINLR
jgi:protein involved in polysaccharide export with SLBB domain